MGLIKGNLHCETFPYVLGEIIASSHDINIFPSLFTSLKKKNLIIYLKKLLILCKSFGKFQTSQFGFSRDKREILCFKKLDQLAKACELEALTIFSCSGFAQ